MFKDDIIRFKNILTKNINENFNNSKHITNYLTNSLVNFAKKNNIKFQLEIKLPNLKGKNNRSGILDLRIFDKKKLDIEIDRGNKKWSIEKLIYCKNILKNDVLWIKWGLPIKSSILKQLKDENIKHIYLPTKSHRIKKI